MVVDVVMDVVIMIMIVKNSYKCRIVWKWETVEHKDVDSMEDNENIVPLEQFPFCETQGLITCTLGENPTVLDFVQLYLTEELFTLIVIETNRYAEEYIESIDEHRRSNLYVGKWEPVTVAEIKRIIGIFILMGVVYKPSISMYWSSDEIFSTPIFGQLMLRNRFLLILKFLHFNNTQGYDPLDENRDRLHKIHPIIDLLHM